MSALTEAALLREVARVQNDKTLQAVRDAVERIKTTRPSKRDTWLSEDVSAKEFKAELVAVLVEMRETA